MILPRTSVAVMEMARCVVLMRPAVTRSAAPPGSPAVTAHAVRMDNSAATD